MKLAPCFDRPDMIPIRAGDVKTEMLYVKAATHAAAHGKYGYGYKEIYCGFDIETTNHIDRESNIKLAFMWIWQFAFDKYIIIGRTWEEFIDILCKIVCANQLSKKKRLLLPIANLGFEFQFFRKHFDNISVFAREERKPLQALLYNCIDCRDVLAISGGSLAQLAKDFTKTQKRVGDLDYSIERNKSYSPNVEEYQYIYNDVVILAEYSKYLFDNFIKTEKYLPITKTAINRHKMKALITPEEKQKVQAGFPSERLYKIMMNQLFRGGYVHSSAANTGFILWLEKMFDFTSSYPAEMIHNKGFPMGDSIRICNIDYKTVCDYVSRETRCFFKIRFKNLQAAIGHSIESESKCEIDGKRIIDNGRIYFAEAVTTWLSDIDLKIYQMFYEFDTPEILEFYYFEESSPLPDYVLNPLKSAYEIKAKLKREHKPYAIEKAICNSYYGTMVTRLYTDDIIYNDKKWSTNSNANSFEKLKKKQFLLPQWGIWLTAFCRYNLLYNVWKIDKDRATPNVVFCDTDSIKLKVYDDVSRETIENYNRRMAEMNKDLPPAFWDLGMFDDETKEETKPLKFKTLGAKRYIYENSKGIHVTIAGLPKGALKAYCERENKDVFEVFSEHMYIDIDSSEKLTTCYNDDETSAIINGEYMHELSSVALFEISFNMNVVGDYISFFINMQNERGGKL